MFDERARYIQCLLRSNTPPSTDHHQAGACDRARGRGWWCGALTNNDKLPVDGMACMVETTSKAVPEDSNLPEARTHDRQVRKIPWRGRAAPRIEIVGSVS